MTDAKPNLSHTPRRGRRLQFALSSLLIVVTACAVAAYVLRSGLEPYRRQRQTMALVQNLGGRVDSREAGAWLLLLVDDCQNVTLVDVADCDDPGNYLDDVVLLPALETLAVGGEAFTDEHLEQLKRVTSLRYLLLDGTSVTEEAIAKFALALPNIDVVRSQRRVIAALRRRKIGVLAWDPASPPQSRKPNAGHAEMRQLLGETYFEKAYRIFSSLAVEDSDLMLIAQLSDLGWIDLRRSQISDQGLRHLKPLPRLYGLVLDRTAITDSGLEHLKGMGLSVLSLGGTRVTDAGLVHLTDLPNLSGINVRDTAVTETALHRVLPHCTAFVVIRSDE
jgi:hypothetical protein